MSVRAMLLKHIKNFLCAHSCNSGARAVYRDSVAHRRLFFASKLAK